MSNANLFTDFIFLVDLCKGIENSGGVEGFSLCWGDGESLGSGTGSDCVNRDSLCWDKKSLDRDSLCWDWGGESLDGDFLCWVLVELFGIR